MNTHDKNGNPTDYGFACGYVQKETLGNCTKELYKEHNTYHVRMFRGSERVIWLSYERLTQARKDYKNTSLCPGETNTLKLSGNMKVIDVPKESILIGPF